MVILLLLACSAMGFLDLLTSTTLNDLKPPLQKRAFSNFLQFLAAAHIFTVNWNEMAEDRLRQLA